VELRLLNFRKAYQIKVFIVAQQMDITAKKLSKQLSDFKRRIACPLMVLLGSKRNLCFKVGYH
jgi:hypothetical protein